MDMEKVRSKDSTTLRDCLNPTQERKATLGRGQEHTQINSQDLCELLLNFWDYSLDNRRPGDAFGAM